MASFEFVTEVVWLYYSVTIFYKKCYYGRSTRGMVCFFLFFTKNKINLFFVIFLDFFFSFLEQCARAEVGRREGSSMSFTA